MKRKQEHVAHPDLRINIEIRNMPSHNPAAFRQHITLITDIAMLGKQTNYCSLSLCHHHSKTVAFI
jgi:hypothetical protein